MSLPQLSHPAPRPLRVVVAANADDESRGALEMAARLSEERNAVVLSVSAVEPSNVLCACGPVEDETRCEVPSSVQRVLNELPVSKRWTRRALRGSPADVINEAAATWDASLIVVGLGHHRAIDRLLGAETTISIIKHATLPVLAVPEATRRLPRNACAAVDFSGASTSAAILAASLLSEKGKLTLLHATPYLGAEADTDAIAQLYRDAAGKRLAEVLALVRRRTGRQVNGLMLDGEPTDTIVKFARDDSCDLVALGGHIQGLVDRILIGSVRTRVLRAVTCSVLVAPPERVGD